MRPNALVSVLHTSIGHFGSSLADGCCSIRPSLKLALIASRDTAQRVYHIGSDQTTPATTCSEVCEVEYCSSRIFFVFRSSSFFVKPIPLLRLQPGGLDAPRRRESPSAPLRESGSPGRLGRAYRTSSSWIGDRDMDLPGLKFHDPRKALAFSLARRGVSTAVTQRLLEGTVRSDATDGACVRHLSSRRNKRAGVGRNSQARVCALIHRYVRPQKRGVDSLDLLLLKSSSVPVDTRQKMPREPL